MDLSEIARKLGISDAKPIIRKAEELRRLSNVQFDSSTFGVGEISKAIICLELAATRLQVPFDRLNAIRLSGMSEKAYNRSFNAMQNGLGVKMKLDIRELGIQFGCVRLIPFVQKGLTLYKDRCIASLPPSRRASADFTRPVFTAAAFYLCARRHKLKVDKLKLIELCGTSETEFSSVSVSMNDLCFDVFGISKEKKDATAVKGNRELLDALPSKRRHVDDGDASEDSSCDSIDDEDGLERCVNCSCQAIRDTRGWRKLLMRSGSLQLLQQMIETKQQNPRRNLSNLGSTLRGNFQKQSPWKLCSIYYS